MTKPTKKYPKRAKDIPVTQAMLFNVRDELKELIKSESKRTDSKFASMEAKFSSIESRFSSVESSLHGMKSELHRVALLIEEQNARNAVVMDGLTNLFERQERIEQRAQAR